MTNLTIQQAVTQTKKRKRRRTLKIKKSHFNKAYLPLLENFTRLQVVYGGSGSGKSEAIARKFIKHVISVPKFNLLVTRKVGDTLRYSCFSLMKKIINNWGIAHWFKITDTKLTIQHKSTGNMIVFKGLDDREKIKSITFENGDLQAVWMEEASEFEEEDYKQLDLRLRGLSDTPKFLLMSFNPINVNHWIKLKIFDVPEIRKDAYILKTTYLDNKFLDEPYKKSLINLQFTDPYYYQVYALGEWGILDANNVIIPVIAVLKARNNHFAEPVGGFEIGADIARYGDDSTVIYIRQGLKIIGQKILKKSSITDCVKAIVAMINEHRNNDSDIVRVKIDETGIGSGVVDGLEERDLRNVEVYGVNNGSKAKDSKKYCNVGTEMYFELGKLLKDCDIPDDQDLAAELNQRQYTINSKSQFKIEPKDEFKKRIGKSPDKGDALCLCFYQPDNIYEDLVNPWG